jgi:N-glycosylase/DNA lyase
MLIEKVKELQNFEVSQVVASRMKEFSEVEDLFGELCFCLMTAGFRADKSIEIQKRIGNGFVDFSLEELRNFLKESGHRFWPQRAERIFLARSVIGKLSRVAKEGDRDWLIENVKGLGMKESSHFLRNVGFEDVAIVDFHIVDLLRREELIGEFKTLSRKKYLEVEDILRGMAKELDMSLAELDLYLWYLETGKILK